MTKPTPPPWRTGVISPNIIVAENHRGGKRDICKCMVWPFERAGQYDEENAANARLMAAAPELLEACERAYFIHMRVDGEDNPYEIEGLKRAIKLAKGE